MTSKYKTTWKNEEYCRKYIEFRFKPNKFPSVRPDWLEYPLTKKNLELDGYCEKLKLAFEYDGIQHFKYRSQFHDTKQEFEAQQKRDRWKDERCKELGITLIRIPYTEKGVYIQICIDKQLRKLELLES